uniref:Uncharacterized protein n=1 Tax=Romanomermis culicivorax TaxID=13658 RepID=A0A915ING8_ROMCU
MHRIDVDPATSSKPLPLIKALRSRSRGQTHIGTEKILSHFRTARMKARGNNAVPRGTDQIIAKYLMRKQLTEHVSWRDPARPYTRSKCCTYSTYARPGNRFWDEYYKVLLLNNKPLIVSSLIIDQIRSLRSESTAI